MGYSGGVLEGWLLPRTLVLVGTFLIVVTAVTGCSQQGQAVAPQSVRILTGSQGGAYNRLGSTLGRVLTDQLPQLRVQVEVSDGSVMNLEQIEQSDGELAIAQSDAAYEAYSTGTDRSREPHTHLRAMARLFPNTVQIAVRQDSAFRRLHDLAGRRVGISDPGKGTASRTMRQVLDSANLPAGALTLEAVAQRDQLSIGLREGRFDAVIAVTAAPAPALLEVSQAIPIRFIGIDAEAIHDIRSRFLFFRPVTIAAGMYPRQTDAIETVGIDTLLICRDTLDEQTVFDLTRAFFESLPQLTSAVPAVRLVDADHAPATSIPLHPGAARYYRERELFR